MNANEGYEAPIGALEDLDVNADLLFDVLARPRRRAALAYLEDQSGPVSLADLAEEITAWERDQRATQTPDDTVEAVRVSLYHVDVPKMSDAGLVVYDKDQGTLTTTATGEEVASLVQLPSLSSPQTPEQRFER